MNSPANTLRNIAITVNPAAGKGKALQLANTIATALAEQQIQFSLFNKDLPVHFEGFSEVWIIGGDGTLNYFLNSHTAINVPLAIFKGGTGNDFAWKLYGDISFEEQLQTVLLATPKQVDAGTCNGKVFINGVGIGFDGEVVKSMGRKRFFLNGHLAYLAVVIKKIFSYQEKQLTLEMDGQLRQEKLFMISIANGARYGGGFLVAPQAIINDALLDIVLIKPVSILKRFFNLPKIEKGQHLQLPFVEVLTDKKIIIRSHATVAAHFDGELLESNAFEIAITPARFHFLY